ncbi:MAG: hypothetical protein DMF89_07060 [Acidobacteria bacterium]|nr:MAG: hypothetical protein DMF89_07060 [Acidobacteriota bacterium]
MVVGLKSISKEGCSATLEACRSSYRPACAVEAGGRPPRGIGLVVTRAELLSQDGPRYFPGSAVPAVADSYQRLGHAFIDCDGGRTLRLEFITGPGTAHGWRIGRDNEGSLYRFTF